MTGLLGALVTALLAWCGVVQPVQAAVSTPMAAGVAYAYHGHDTSAEVLNDASERGPPAACVRDATYNAVGRGSHGAAARSGAPVPRPTTTYATPAIHAPRTRATTTTGRRVSAADGDLYAPGGANASAAKTADNVLPTPQVGSTKLQNLVGNLYKGTTNPNRVGNGTTMDAIRNELATGVPTAGRMHSIKGQETLNGVNNWLRRNPDAAYHDRLVGQSLADELSLVLRGGG